MMSDRSRVSVEIVRRDKTEFWVFEAPEKTQNMLHLRSVEILFSVAAIYTGVEVEE